METVYDWVTVGIFAGLIVLFLQRSVGPVHDRAWPYAVAAVGCAVLNQVGNKALDDDNMMLHAVTVISLLGLLAFIQYFLRPFDRSGDS